MKPFKAIYISGPMSGKPDFNFPAFHSAAASLRSLGYEVHSPAELNLNTSLPWEVLMRHALRQMLLCDAIYMLEGWSNSKGAKIEWNLANGLNMIVNYQGTENSWTRKHLQPA